MVRGMDCSLKGSGFESCVVHSSKLIFKSSWIHTKVMFCLAQLLKTNIPRFQIGDLEKSALRKDLGKILSEN